MFSRVLALIGYTSRDVILQIYRPQGDNSYVFIGEYCHNALEAGVANVDVAGGQGTTLQVTFYILVLRDDINLDAVWK